MTSLFILLLCASILPASLADYDWDDWTELDEYVWNDDGAYSYTHLVTYEYPGVTLYVYNMTSQYYLDDTKVDHVLWWHVMGVAVPHEIRLEDAGFVFLIGGSNRNHDPPPAADLNNVGVVKMANDTGLIGCYVAQVINGPITYYNDPQLRGLTGDSQIAWTWRTFIDFPEWAGPTIITRFPMTKAAKAGVDALTDIVRDETGMELERFVTTGASKWGWTVWSHMATDRRLVGAVPIVFSMFKIEETMMSHYQALEGAWSFAMAPYYNENLTQEIDNPNAEAMAQYEDMYYYRRRYEGIPKFSISATGDEYFFPQDFHHWWDEFPEPKWLWMVPNGEHVLFPHWADTVLNVEAFWVAVLEGFELPTITWERYDHEDTGEVIMHADTEPLEILAWRAVTLDNDTRRDFRLVAGDPPGLHPVRWFEEDVEDLGDNSYRHVTDHVEEEWVGHYIEGMFEGPDDWTFFFSTEVNIVPDTFPAEPCTTSEECWSILV